jgi:hypothetical protein
MSNTIEVAVEEKERERRKEVRECAELERREEGEGRDSICSAAMGWLEGSARASE